MRLYYRVRRATPDLPALVSVDAYDDAGEYVDSCAGRWPEDACALVRWARTRYPDAIAMIYSHEIAVGVALQAGV